MKNTARYFLAMSLLLFWSSLSADGVIKNGAKLKLKKGTHLIEKGSIHILPNSTLQIEGMLTIDGEFTNEAGYSGIIIKSNVENTGSLIYNEGSPQAQVERYMSTRSSHYIGSSVSGETAEVLNYNGNPSTLLYQYTDGSGLSLLENNDELVLAQGYYYNIGSNASGGITPEFQGNLNSQDLELNNSSTPPLVFNAKGVNIIANPYACAIDWDDENINLTDMEKSVWVYDSKKRRYRFRNTSGLGNLIDGIIPMGQGFNVRAKNNNASISIPKEARRHEDQAFYKSNNAINDELSFLILEITKDTLSDEIWVGYQWESSDGFDDGIDISKMFTFEDEPQIYTAHNDLELSVDIIAEIGNDAKTVPVNFIVGTSGQHQLELMKFEGFNGVSVQLEDLVNGDLMDVNEMDIYEFNANIDDNVERFLLHFNPFAAVSTDDISTAEAMVNMYAYQNTIYISSEGTYADQSKNILIYDVNGKQLGEVFLPAGKMQKIENIYQRKVLILKAIYPEQIFTRKILNF